ncbi:class I SAM-dependent methyltransferase [Anoxybacteroides tepidamans]|uniref:class I SAM-dependent methyltransferase n=1 Tax=Anoxybacteroides tepidamans TaxID=265948 RepID=UPI000686D7BD|nr:class I SAM-dependent methyltransferase [Anoxybacillus tepidamans]
MKRFFEQFARPTGFLGKIAGKVLEKSNQELNEWTISLLNIQKEDVILEIGFGPGVAIEEAAKLAVKGMVYGIDYSKVMIKQATRRNKKTIDEGRVKLIYGNASDLPSWIERLDKVYCVNVIMFWDSPIDVLKNIRGRMNNGAIIAVTVQPRDEKVKKICTEIDDYLKKAGFSGIRTEKRDIRSIPAVCVIGVNE